MNKISLLQGTPFILCLVSALVLVIFTERASIFGINRVLISIIQNRKKLHLKCHQEYHFCSRYQKEPLGCGVLTVPN